MSLPDSTSPSPLASGARRWLAPLLVASVAVNLLIVGAAFSGRIWPEHGERGGYHRSFDLLPRQFFADINDERRAELAAVFRARKAEFREQHRALREAAAAFADVLEREPYDRQLAQSAIAEHSGRSRQLIDLGAAITGTLVEAMTPGERRALAEAIRQRLEQDRARRSSRSRQ